jgi:catechol 2,3-dioxygenase-like lactoylglutathione lyase family enzyme
MTQDRIDSAKIQVKEFGQFSIVVKDVETVARNFWNILGIGPWDIYSLEAPYLDDHIYYGKPAWHKAKIALAQAGSVQLELYQPVEGDSICSDFLKSRGEWMHNIGIFVDDADAVAAELVREGFPCLESGRYGDDGAFYYIDTKPLRTIWKIVQRSSSMGAALKRIPEREEESQAKVKVKEVMQIALVVENAKIVSENYELILGIGPWDHVKFEPPFIHDRRYQGRPAWGREICSFTTVGGLSFELCEYVDGDSIFRDFLREHGEGLQHFNFHVDNQDETAEALTSQGFTSIRSGRRGTEGPSGNYIVIEPLHSIWEIIQKKS